MTIVITAWDRSPDGGMGLARDTRVRWALEEVDQPYEVRLVSLQAKTEPAHLRVHPFGLIPTYEEGDLALFETGAIDWSNFPPTWAIPSSSTERSARATS